jgi:putative ABC transport system permease protein
MPRTIADLLFDLKYALRTLRNQPSFSLAVALTLALGLGLNASVLGMMDALLLRPFQFHDYQRLIVVFESPKGTSDREPVSPATYLDWRAEMRSVERLVAWENWGATLSGNTEPERLGGFRVSTGFFELLRIRPPTGRAFDPSEEQPGNERRVIIGDGLWKRRFGADPRVVGTDVLLDAVPHTIVGIAPPGFDFPVGAEIWVPLAFTPERAADRRNRTLIVLGKLGEGRSLADARSELEVIGQRLAAQHPETNIDRGVSIRTLSTAFTEDSSASFVGILQLGALLVLLVACANLGGLLLARANDRQREVAVRTALGASRMRIVRQLVTETIVLSLVASAIALIFARTGLDLLHASIPAEMARYIEGWNNVRLSVRLVAVIPACALVLGVIVGIIPALSVARGNLTGALKDGERGGSGGVKRQRARQLLVVAEIAFALTLLVAAGLALAGSARMINAPSGFDSRSLLTFNVPLPQNTYGDAAVRREFANRLLTQIEAIPGVERVAVANVLPAAGWSPSRPLFVEDAPEHESARQPTTGYRAVSAGYFETMKIRMVSGRPFASVDGEHSQPVAIVSASLAQRYWPGRDAIGERLKLGDANDPWFTIIGVADDVTMYNWWDGRDFSAVYVPLRQSPPTNGMSVVVRTRGEPSALAGTARVALASVDPLLAVDNVRTMAQAIDVSTFGLNFMGALLGICGAIALLLAVVGTYSMMSYAVSQRRHEFGIRMALGASAQDVLRLSLQQAGMLTAAGLGIGVVLAGILARLMSSALAGVVQLDLTTLAAVTGTLGVVSVAAAYLPAWRSVRFDPATVLRSQ